MLFLLPLDEKEASDAEKLYIRYSKKMYVIAYNILGNRHDSEDAVMEAFKRIIKNANKFRTVSTEDADALAAVYVKNASIDIYNANKKRLKYINEYDCEPQLLDDRTDSLDLSGALGQLPYGYASLIILKYHYGYSSKQAAEALGISELAARKRLERAKKLLKEVLEKEGVDP